MTCLTVSFNVLEANSKCICITQAHTTFVHNLLLKLF